MLVLNEEQIMFQDSVRGFLQKHAPVSALRELRDSQDKIGFSRDLWEAMSDMGWAGINIPEEFGGLEFGFVGLGIILEEMGKTLTVSPIVSTVLLGATALVYGGTEKQKVDYLPTIVSGEKIVALALEEGIHHAPAKTALRATRTSDGFCLNGEKSFVLDGHVADTFIVVARTAGQVGDRSGLTLFLVNSAVKDVSMERTCMMDSRNSATVKFDNVTVASDSVLGELNNGMELLESVLDVAQIGLSAEMLGICQQVFEMTLTYLKERKQFGVHIGSFQALQHRAAQLFCEIELCRSVVIKALKEIDDGAEGIPALASLAKSKLCETVKRLTNEAIQMHGGIGMTDEFDLGFYIKRARSVQKTFGDCSYHLDRFARLNAY